ncbi:MAG: protein kinase [Myxococcota bacterium]|nr:protein kinase [Myxococcota bacterium]
MDSPDSVRRFEFLREIASGGFGSVFLTKVMHPDGFSRIAAVKLLHRRWSENEEIARRMRDEARLLGWLRHRNIVDVVDLTSLDGRAAIIMEYLEAADLKAIDLQLGHTEHALPPRAALDVVAAVASALDAAYNRPPYPGEKPLRVIHRDIKPSNIMIDDSGLVKVLDFGVARAEFDARESDTRELQFGSIDYMPPERLLFEPESPGSDIYSLGATLFEVLGNDKLGKARGSPEKHQAFLADRMSYLRGALGLSGALGTELENLISSCLTYDAEARPDAAELVKLSRKLAKDIGGMTIQEWSETHVMTVIRSTVEGSDRFNPLTGRTLSEDRTSIGQVPSERPAAGSETVQMVDGEAQTLPEMPVLEKDRAEVPGPPTLEELPSLDSLAIKKEEPAAEDPWEDEPTRLEDPEKLRERMREEEVTDRGGEEAAEEPLPAPKEEAPVVRKPMGGLDASLPLSIPGASASIAAGVVDGATLLMDEAGGDAATMLMPEGQDEEAPVGLGDEGATRLMPEDEILGAESGPGDDATWLLAEEGPGGEEPVVPPAAPASAPAPPPELGAAPPPPTGPANAPPMPDSMGSLGSETVFTAIGGGATGPLEHTDTTVVGRVAASLLVFVIAGVVALGAGAVIFRDEISNLLGGGSEPVAEAPAPPVEQPVETQAVEPPSEPAVAAPDPLEGFDGSTVAFESLLEGTSRLVVRCKGVSAEGVKSVVLSEASVSRCVVTAYPSEGRQLMLAIPGETTAGLTRCFEGGERSCGS